MVEVEKGIFKVIQSAEALALLGADALDKLGDLATNTDPVQQNLTGNPSHRLRAKVQEWFDLGYDHIIDYANKGRNN